MEAIAALVSSPAFQMVGAAVNAIGAIQQGQDAAAAAEYNARIMEQNAATERQQASQREDAKRRETARILGSQRAALAQSGGGMGGSATDVMGQSSIDAELDALTLRYEGELRARGMQNDAAAERFAGRNARRAGYMAAAGSILSGAARYGEALETKRYRDTMRRTYDPVPQIPIL